MKIERKDKPENGKDLWIMQETSGRVSGVSVKYENFPDARVGEISYKSSKVYAGSDGEIYIIHSIYEISEIEGNTRRMKCIEYEKEYISFDEFMEKYWDKWKKSYPMGWNNYETMKQGYWEVEPDHIYIKGVSFQGGRDWLGNHIINGVPYEYSFNINNFDSDVEFYYGGKFRSFTLSELVDMCELKEFIDNNDNIEWDGDSFKITVSNEE